ncbi:MAG: cytochrome c [Gammaproteobacteria bacterium]|jgi:cytochrome c556|nr:cytochrome c [Gammaproteobacteria bacterium]
MLLKHVTITLLASVLLIAHPSWANEAFELRAERMTILGKETKSMAAMVKGRTEFDADDFLYGALHMHMAMDGLLQLFPAGSHGGDSAAKAKIWDNWEDFTAQASATADAIAVLAIAADKGNEQAIRQAFGKLAKSCSSCHRKYRNKH